MSGVLMFFPGDYGNRYIESMTGSPGNTGIASTLPDKSNRMKSGEITLNRPRNK